MKLQRMLQKKVQQSSGGRERVRTADPLLAKQVLSQLSYTPTVASVIDSKASLPIREI